MAAGIVAEEHPADGRPRLGLDKVGQSRGRDLHGKRGSGGGNV